MDDVHRVRVVGPLEPYAAGIAAELTRLGYTLFSAREQLGLVAHLSRWLAGEGLDASMLTPVVVAQFLVARRGAGYTAYRTPKALSPLLGYLRGLGVTPLPVVPEPEGPVEVLLERYSRYLVGERGLGAPTARGYVDLIRPFVVSRPRPTRSTWRACRLRTWWDSCSPSAVNGRRRRHSGWCLRCGRCSGFATCRV
jgi:hypothetical protein